MSTLTIQPAAPAPARTVAARLFVLLLLPLAPALVGGVRGLLPYFHAEDSEAVVAAVAADPGAQETIVWLGFLAMLTLPVAALWAGRPLYAGAPKLTAAAEVLLVPAYLCLSVLVALDMVLLHGVRNDVDPSVVAGMYDGLHASANVGLGIFVLGHVLGTVLLGIAAIRTRVIPLWAGIALAICQPLHFVALIVLGSQPLDAFAWGLNAIAFGFLGVRLYRSA